MQDSKLLYIILLRNYLNRNANANSHKHKLTRMNDWSKKKCIQGLKFDVNVN